MGIWRHNTARKRPQPKDSYSLFENSDPFEHDDSFMGSFRAPARPESISSSRSARAQTIATHRSTNTHKTATRGEVNELLDADFSKIAKMRTSRNILIYGLLAVAIAVTGFTVAKYRPWATWGSPELVYAYFEVRAVDGAGRPVAGANVKNGGKKVGTTDSFGEWRRYMRVPLGATVPITITKATTGEPLYAIKNFAVPPEKPEKSDMELRASIQLQSGSAGMMAAAAPSVTAVKERAPSDIKSQTQGSVSEARDTLVASQATAEAVAPPHPDKASTAETAHQPEAVTANSTAFVSSHESIWFEIDPAQSGQTIHQAVLPALVQRAKELGLRVEQTASWHVKLASLIEPPKTIGADGAGLIEITTSEQGTAQKQFLRNYLADSRVTARGILYVLSHEVNKNVAISLRDGRWVASLPKVSSELWRVAGGMSLTNGSREWLVGVDPYIDSNIQGYYLASAENPCGAGKTSCELKTRSFSEVPAVPTWTRLKLRLITAAKEKDSIKVFVSGYETKSTGDNVLEYWGQDHARANVTVIQNGKVTQRLQIVNDMRQPVSVALGAASMSRR